MTIYAGLDVSDKTTHICVVDGEGVVVRRDVVATDPDVLTKWLKKHCPGLVRVVLETGENRDTIPIYPYRYSIATLIRLRVYKISEARVVLRRQSKSRLKRDQVAAIALKRVEASSLFDGCAKIYVPRRSLIHQILSGKPNAKPQRHKVVMVQARPIRFAAWGFLVRQISIVSLLFAFEEISIVSPLFLRLYSHLDIS